MATKRTERVVSNLAIHPGELLEEEMEFVGMSRVELAERMGVSPQAVGDIIEGKRDVTDDIAAGLENVLGSPAHIWINSQERYDFTRAQSKEALED